MALHENIPFLDDNENVEEEENPEEDYHDIDFNEIANLGRQVRQHYIMENII